MHGVLSSEKTPVGSHRPFFKNLVESKLIDDNGNATKELRTRSSGRKLALLPEEAPAAEDVAPNKKVKTPDEIITEMQARSRPPGHEPPRSGEGVYLH